MQLRFINSPGTHSVTSGDNGKLIIVECAATLSLDSPAGLGAGWECRVKNRTLSSAIIEVVRADGLPIDGAEKTLLPFTHDNLHLVSDGADILALDQWYRRQQGPVSHRTVTVQNVVPSMSWSAGVKDIGAIVRVSCAAIPQAGLPAASIMIVLPPLTEIGGPPYRRGGLWIQRIDGGGETVTVFAAANEAPINGVYGYQLPGANNTKFFYADGQQWTAW